MDVQSDRGDVSLLRVVATVIIIGLVCFELGAVMVTRLQTDELAQTAVRTAAQAYANPATRTQVALEDAARSVLADRPRARLDALVLTPEGIDVTVSQEAGVLVIHRIGPLADFATITVTKRASLR